jgi:hypothetical protein
MSLAKRGIQVQIGMSMIARDLQGADTGENHNQSQSHNTNGAIHHRSPTQDQNQDQNQVLFGRRLVGHRLRRRRYNLVQNLNLNLNRSQSQHRPKRKFLLNIRMEVDGFQ